MLLEKKKINIKNFVLDYIRYKQLNCCGYMQKIIIKKAPSKNFGMVPIWKTKKGKTSKFVDAGGYNRNGRNWN